MARCHILEMLFATRTTYDYHMQRVFLSQIPSLSVVNYGVTISSTHVDNYGKYSTRRPSDTAGEPASSMINVNCSRLQLTVVKVGDKCKSARGSSSDCVQLIGNSRGIRCLIALALHSDPLTSICRCCFLMALDISWLTRSCSSSTFDSDRKFDYS